VVVLLLEVMAADWNAHVPDVAVAVIAAKSAVEYFIFVILLLLQYINDTLMIIVE